MERTKEDHADMSYLQLASSRERVVTITSGRTVEGLYNSIQENVHGTVKEVCKVNDDLLLV